MPVVWRWRVFSDAFPKIKPPRSVHGSDDLCIIHAFLVREIPSVVYPWTIYRFSIGSLSRNQNLQCCACSLCLAECLVGEDSVSTASVSLVGGGAGDWVPSLTSGDVVCS